MRGRRWLVSAALVAAVGSVVWAQGASGPVGLESTVVLQTSSTSLGQPLVFPALRSQFTGVLLEFAPGGRVGRHRHPFPTLAYVLQGEVTVEADGQAPRVYRAGQAFSEGDHWHDAVNSGSVPAKVWVVFAGAEGGTLTVRASGVRTVPIPGGMPGLE